MSGGGWTKIGWVTQKVEMKDTWLRSNQNTANVAGFNNGGGMACIDAVDMAVNHASDIRIANSDGSKYVQWSMDSRRTTSTWWNRGVGQSTIGAASNDAVTVYSSGGGSSSCYQ